MSETDWRVAEIARRAGTSAGVVRNVLALSEKVHSHRPGTVKCAGPGLNMALMTEKGWVKIPNTTFTPSGYIVAEEDVAKWPVVFTPQDRP